MQEGEPGYTMEKSHDSGTCIEAIHIRSPRLKRTAWHVKHLGRLALGHTLDFQIAVPRKQVSAFAAIPTLVAIIVVTLLVLDDYSHSSPPSPATVRMKING